MKRKCKGCGRDISHKHPNAKFCSPRCKDKFHNWNNPRGIYAHLKGREHDPEDDMHTQDPYALGQWED